MAVLCINSVDSVDWVRAHGLQDYCRKYSQKLTFWDCRTGLIWTNSGKMGWLNKGCVCV